MKETTLHITERKSRTSSFVFSVITGLLGLLLGIGIGELAKNFVGERVLVSGSSMEPTYYEGDKLTGIRIKESDTLQWGDIVSLSVDGYEFSLIKRVVGCPGDTLEIREGVFYRNGEKVEEPYLSEEVWDWGILQESPIVLEEGQYFCMGDNRNHSYDSRGFGPVSREQIELKIKEWKDGVLESKEK